jgi:hypothetical protein
MNGRRLAPPSGKIADFGLQEFHGDQAEARRVTAEFLRRYDVPDSQVEQICSPVRALSVADVYRALGHKYVAIDVQQAKTVHFFDLNCFAPPDAWCMSFDRVLSAALFAAGCLAGAK